MVAEKDQVLGWYANEPRQILRSSTSEEPYEARWYRREGSAEDPWISLNDHMAELETVAFTGVPAEGYTVTCTGGDACQQEDGRWVLNNHHVTF